MIFQPNEFCSGPNGSENTAYGGCGRTPEIYARHSAGNNDRPSAVPLPLVNRLSISDGPRREPSSFTYPDALSHPRTLRLVIAGVQHRGEAVLTDLAHEFPNLAFSPTPRHIAFRAALLDAVKPSLDGGNATHSLIRQERVHRALGTALSNLVARAMQSPLHELSCDDAEITVVPADSEMNEYLASSWAVRSFIRVATSEPEMFRVLVTEMAAIHSNFGRFTLGVPMSPLLVYELFNAAAQNPALAPDVVRAFQIIGYQGDAGEKLFKEFSLALEKQVTGRS